ncbi:MAG: four helix bundle protein [Cytophagaceae bacterium]|nr:four helix bundle protein [Cytophagaceae bacterium]
MKNEQLGGSGNAIVDKSYDFALRILQLGKHLREQQEYLVSKQVVRCGTSIGANVEEAQGGQSKADFIAKMQIALKEARETKYWLRLLRDSKSLELRLAESLIQDAEELLRLLNAILISSKDR